MEDTSIGGRTLFKSIVVRYNFPAIHHWKDIPPEHPHQFLKYPHRHLFYVELEVQVGHNNRDVEFLELKEGLASYCDMAFGNHFRCPTLVASCEDMAESIFKHFSNNQLFVLRVSVFEDNENGAVIRMVKDGY